MKPWAVAAIVLLLVGCSSEPSDSPPRCTPGASAECFCIGGSAGAQICGADGTFDECVCASVQDAGADTGMIADTAVDVGQPDVRPDVWDAAEDGGQDLGEDAEADAAADCGQAGALLGCADAATQRVCGSDGDEMLVACPDQTTCVGGDCEPVVCTPNQGRCVGLDAEICTPDGTAWNAVETCGVECVSGTCTCSRYPADNCPAGENCYVASTTNNVCLTYDAAALEGDGCAVDSECNDGQSCVTDDGVRACRDNCEVGAASCPQTRECRSAPGATLATCLPPSVAGMACDNASDLAIINTDANMDGMPDGMVEAAADACVAGCFGNPDVAGCTGMCVSTDTGVSAACGQCYGGLAQCNLLNCLAECLFDPMDAACLTCRAQAGCDTSFTACAGI